MRLGDGPRDNRGEAFFDHKMTANFVFRAGLCAFEVCIPGECKCLQEYGLTAECNSRIFLVLMFAARQTIPLYCEAAVFS